MSTPNPTPKSTLQAITIIGNIGKIELKENFTCLIHLLLIIILAYTQAQLKILVTALLQGIMQTIVNS